MFWRVLALVWLSFAPASHAFAATLTSITTKDGKIIVVLTGDISEGDTDRLKAAIKSANDGGRLVYAIRGTRRVAI